MLDFDTILQIFRTYGYSSVNHPYLYKKGDTYGVCYDFFDKDYGELERIKYFETLDELDDFLKKYQWVRANGLTYNARMALDNYELEGPEVVFLRNDKIMVRGEMFNIAEFDNLEARKPSMDLASRLILEAGNLLLVYDEMKARQVEYIKTITALKNTLRTKYFELQKEIDLYNELKYDRELSLLPDTVDMSSIDENSERIVKDKYNQFRVSVPSVEEAATFVNDVWNLNMGLENNYRYYESQMEESEIRSEIMAVNKKMDLVMGWNDNVHALFKKDLNKAFKSIERYCKRHSVKIPKDYIQNKINDAEKKYSYLNDLSIYHLADYLKEALINTNYEDIVKKYPKDSKDNVKSDILPVNQIAIDLFNQYKKFIPQEQAILILYNSKYRAYFDNIFEIKGYEVTPVKKIIKRLNSIKGFTKVKSECFDSVKDRIQDPVNEQIKTQLFSNIDFTSYETFVTSMINLCNMMKNITNKLILNSDINMYYYSPGGYYIFDKTLRMVTNNLAEIVNNMDPDKDMVCMALLKKGTPILYSPYYLDLGDIYNKDGLPNMYIREMVNFDLIMILNDVNINKSPNIKKVVRYTFDPVMYENINIIEYSQVKDVLSFNNVIFGGKIDVNNVSQEVVNTSDQGGNKQ